MRLYQTVAVKDSGDEVVWTGSMSDASKSRTTFRKQGLVNVVTTEVDVPTTKTDLLIFLNKSKAIHE